MVQKYLQTLKATDPEFADFFPRFVGKEVVNEPGKGLDERPRYIAVLAALLGC